MINKNNLHLVNKLHQQGFTLLEMCFVLIIISSVMITSLAFISNIEKNKQFDETKSEMEEIINAFKVYYKKNGNLPCPAPYFKNEESEISRFISVDCNDSNFEKNIPVPIKISNYRKEEEIRSVYIGKLPINKLNLNLSFYKDSWDTPYTYAVTKELTRISDQDNITGNIDIIMDSQSIVYPEKNILFTLISHGPNKSNEENCLKESLEEENCDSDYTFSLAEFSNSDDPNYYYDDLILYESSLNINEEIEMCDVNDFLDSIDKKPTKTYPSSVPVNHLIEICSQKDCQAYLCDSSGYFLKSLHRIE